MGGFFVYIGLRNMEKDILSFQLNRQTIELYKKFFEILEDIQSLHEGSVTNLRKALILNQERLKKNHELDVFLEPLAAQAHYFDKKLYNQYRKRILDAGNECVRRNEEELEKYNIKVKG